MRTLVDGDLKHIPRVKDDLPQNLLRSAYNGLRQHHLKHDADTPLSLTILDAVQAVTSAYPNARLVFDKRYFGVP